MAVSKRHPVQSIEKLFNAGQFVFGENYIQEALQKITDLPFPDIKWHFIGHLQSNKAKFAAGSFSLIHSVDSFKLAHALHVVSEKKNIIQNVLIQINAAMEKQKSGIEPDQVESLTRQVLELPSINLSGFMCMPPFFDDPEKTRPYFKTTRELRDMMQDKFKRAFPHLSMGMSMDFPQAIEEGATLVRIGTDIFGPRPDKVVK